MTIEIKTLTAEDIEKMCLEVELLAHLVGFKTVNEYQDFKYHVAEGLVRFGGSFLRPLGHALMSADSINSVKIIRTWREACEEHAELHRKFIAKRDEGK